MGWCSRLSTPDPRGWEFFSYFRHPDVYEIQTSGDVEKHSPNDKILCNRSENTKHIIPIYSLLQYGKTICKTSVEGQTKNNLHHLWPSVQNNLEYRLLVIKLFVDTLSLQKFKLLLRRGTYNQGMRVCRSMSYRQTVGFSNGNGFQKPFQRHCPSASS